MRRFVAVTCLSLAVVVAGVPAASAQSIGTFRWNLAPFCNVVTLGVTQLGSSYILNGFDDQCGGGRAPVSGLAFLNPNGTVGLGLSIIATPGAAPVHVNVTVTLGTIGGPWRDSAGNIGTFVFNPPSPAPGTPRPATGGLISTVAAGPGLNGGGVTGAVSLSVEFAGPGTATTVARSDHTHAAPGSNNVAVGPLALSSPTTAAANSAFGSSALRNVTSGIANTAVGNNALRSATTAVGSVAIGTAALTSGNGNGDIAVGFQALALSTIGQGNTALGGRALESSLTGDNNTAVGSLALFDATGSGNIAIGAEAGFRLSGGNSNIYIGHNGPNPAGSETGRIRIGTAGSQTDTFIAGIHNATVSAITDQAVLVDSTGKLGTVLSSARFKQDVRSLEGTSDAVLRLEPVAFRYVPEQQRGDALQFGLIAEQVAGIMPELVIRDEEGQPLTVKYHLLPTLLLAQIQRLERERAAQAIAIQELRDEVRALRARQQ